MKSRQMLTKCTITLSENRKISMNLTVTIIMPMHHKFAIHITLNVPI